MQSLMWHLHLTLANKALRASLSQTAELAPEEQAQLDSLYISQWLMRMAPRYFNMCALYFGPHNTEVPPRIGRCWCTLVAVILNLRTITYPEALCRPQTATTPLQCITLRIVDAVLSRAGVVRACAAVCVRSNVACAGAPCNVSACIFNICLVSQQYEASSNG